MKLSIAKKKGLISISEDKSQIKVVNVLVMRPNFQVLLMLFIISVSTQAQNNETPSLNIGDHSPSLRVSKWLKGRPLQSFEEGKVYVVEFWATWCKPCIAAMPHLSALARKYKDKLTVIGIDVYEKDTSIVRVKNFVDSMSERMDYYVATDENKFMETFWVKSSGSAGIPKTIIVNAQGKIAWIGHPKDLGEILPKIVDNTWDIKEALARRNLHMHLAYLDEEAYYDLYPYADNRLKRGDLGQPDSALLMIADIVKKEPKLKYAPFIASNTFSSLLKTNLQKAYEYGKIVIVTPTYEEPAYGSIYGIIDFYSDKLNLSAEIYQLGAKAFEAEISEYPYPELANIPKDYHQIAWWYWLAKNKLKAVEAEQIAVNTLKNRGFFLPSELAVYQSQLEQYEMCSVDD